MKWEGLDKKPLFLFRRTGAFEQRITTAIRVSVRLFFILESPVKQHYKEAQPAVNSFGLREDQLSASDVQVTLWRDG